MIGGIVPKASDGHEYILVAIDYFTKWVETAYYSVLKAKHMAWFIENNIICCYGVPQEIISDNGSHFKEEVRMIMELYNIEHNKSSPYQPQTNGDIEAANKNIGNILAKMVDWTEKLPFALWVIELLSVYQLRQPLTLWSMAVKRYFPFKWRYNLC